VSTEKALESLSKITSEYPKYKAAHVSRIAIAYDMEDSKLEEYLSNARVALKQDFDHDDVFRAFEHLANVEKFPIANRKSQRTTY